MKTFFVAKPIFFIVFVALKLLPVFSSIHFDEVEFYDPNKTLDESSSNGFVCAHLGEECQITAQCCGVATCALPSWSKVPVCLVPGYKHDERFRKRFFSLHNLRPEDIRYIRDSYNTSQYDFLLSDLTFSAPPLEEVVSSSSSETMNKNTTVHNELTDEASDDFGTNESVVSTFVENAAENNQTMNDSTSENDQENPSLKLLINKDLEYNLNNNSTESVSSLHFLEESNSVSYNFSKNSSQIYNFNLKNHFMFLLINKSFGLSDSKLNLKEYYDQIINTDKFKNIVDQLREKLRKLNEIEKTLSNNKTEYKSTSINNSTETDKLSTKKTETNHKSSKWNIVKKFFLRGKGSPKRNFTRKHNNHLKGIVGEVAAKEISSNKSQENIGGQSHLYNVYDENPNDNEGFKKLIEDVDKIEKIIDSDRTINTFHGLSSVNDEGLFDFYNINFPFTSAGRNTEETRKINDSLDSVFEEMGDTISSMIRKNKDEGKSKEGCTEMENETQENNLTQPLLSDFSKTINEKKTSTAHFWNKIHFWKVHTNLPTEMEINFKKWFFPKNKSVTAEKQNKLTPLNENFLLNLNSKTTQGTTTLVQAEQQTEPAETTSEYTSSSSESEYSSTEDLYNNSYVFVVNKEKLEEPLKPSSWKKVINFFRKEKAVPVSINLSIHDIPTRISCDSENIHSQTGPEMDPSLVSVPEIIRLPEYLLPPALEKRQENETDWIFEDSEDLEDTIFEEHKTSNSSFFFFF